MAKAELGINALVYLVTCAFMTLIVTPIICPGCGAEFDRSKFN